MPPVVRERINEVASDPVTADSRAADIPQAAARPFDRALGDFSERFGTFPRALRDIVIIAVAYYLTGRLGFLLAMPPGNVTAVWPPSGIALAAILLRGPRVWPGIWLGSFVTNAWFFGQAAPLAPGAVLAAGSIALGSTLQALLGGGMIRKVVPQGNPLERAQDVFKFVALGMTSCLVAATVGVTALCLGGFAPWVNYGPTWWTWWQGDAVGMIAFAPLPLAFARAPRWSSSRRQEALVLLLVLLVAAYLVFDGHFPLDYTLIPFLLWAAFRFDHRGVAVVSVAISVIAIWGTVHGRGPFARESRNEALLLLQAFVAIATVTGLAVAAVLAERQRAEAALQQAHDELESRVLERTAELAEANESLRTEVGARQQAEARLRVYAAKLEQNNRELQDFAYVASHDLQEPLRKVQAFGDRLQFKFAEVLTEQGRDYLKRMSNAAARMQVLVNDLLAYSRVITKPQPFELVDLHQVAREVLADLDLRVQQTGAEVALGPLPRIQADATQMRQLLQNLIGNALKYHAPDAPPRVAVQCENGAVGADDTIRLLVADNGIGFDEKYLDRIFTPFQRLHGRLEYEGTGIGLAICRRIVERHGGSITARSAPGHGATFVVTLPVQQDSGGEL